MNPFEFVIAIIAITTIGGIIKAKHSARHALRDDRAGRRSALGLGRGADDDLYPDETADTVRLREEVRMLKERIATLERITVEKESSLNREIDSLRDRP